jgi:hypothetical protein
VEEPASVRVAKNGQRPNLLERALVAGQRAGGWEGGEFAAEGFLEHCSARCRP